MNDTLHALLNGERIGTVERRAGRLRFVYAAAWQGAPERYPLSLSMPLAVSDHGHKPIEAFMWGLLPDNERILEGWAKRFHVSARSPFALLSYVGEDCAGAVQFVREERLPHVIAGAGSDVTWLSTSDVAQRLRTLRGDYGAGRLTRDSGQFSLAGAQPKTALLFDGKRWGVPGGRTPTTHILKPPVPGLDGHLENEHVCSLLARAAKLPTASSDVVDFDQERALVVERYDRVWTSAARTARSLQRLHQEDLCQALGVMPTLKYQSDGAPTPKAIARLLRDNSSRAVDDVNSFVDALAFNWAIAGTDAHAKNYSILIAPGELRLAPLYDLGSALPYSDIDRRRMKLAMKLGSSYRINEVYASDFTKLAKELELDSEQVVGRARDVVSALGDNVTAICRQVEQDGLERAVLQTLAKELSAHIRRCARALSATR